MNQNQKIVLWVSAAIMAALLVFAPGMGGYSIFDAPNSYVADWGRLALRAGAVGVLSLASFFTAR